MLFFIFFTFIVSQRILELVVAKRNEKWMKEKGAREFGQQHYPFIVLLHVSFLLSFFLEVNIFDKVLSPAWPILLPIFFLLQAGRIWALTTLGQFWNTKIIVLPGAEAVRKGPYKLFKHPNYVIVALEIIVIPLLFQAYATAAVFTVLNACMMLIRIPAEEQALQQLAKYEQN